MSEIPTFFSAAELAAFGLPEFPATQRGVQQWMDRSERGRQDKEGLWWRRRAGRGGGVEYNIKLLPLPAQAAILNRLRADELGVDVDIREAMARDIAWVRFARSTQRARDKASARMRAVRAVSDRQSQGWATDVAVDSVAVEFKIAKSALYDWMRRVRGVRPDDQIAHLIDAPKAGGRAPAACAPEAWEFFKADYLRPARPSFESCYRRLQRVAAQKGWTVPCCRTLKRRVGALPRPVVVLQRQGETALKAMYPAQTRDRSVFHALEAVCTDGHELDVFVRWEDGKVGRPQLLGFQDLYSGMILSWRVDRTENKEVIRLAFGDLVEEFGIPDHCYLDNGRAFASKWITGGAKSRFRFKAKQEDPLGVMALLSVEPHFVNPYSGQSKPIERAWRDFADDISRDPRLAGAYTGPNTQQKPHDYGSRAVPIEQLLSVIADLVPQHNNRAGRGTRVCGGRLSFRQAFDESYGKSIIRKASSAQRQFLLLAGEVLTVRRPDATLHLLGNRYWSGELFQYMGKKVTVRFDPQCLHDDLQVYGMDGALICAAGCIEAVGFNNAAEAADHARRRRAFFRATREASELERGMSISDIAALLEQTRATPAPAPATKVVRLVAGNTALAPRTAQAEAAEVDGMNEIDRMWLAGHRATRLRLVEDEAPEL